MRHVFARLLVAQSDGKERLSGVGGDGSLVACVGEMTVGEFLPNSIGVKGESESAAPALRKEGHGPRLRHKATSIGYQSTVYMCKHLANAK